MSAAATVLVATSSILSYTLVGAFVRGIVVRMTNKWDPSDRDATAFVRNVSFIFWPVAVCVIVFCMLFSLITTDSFLFLWRLVSFAGEKSSDFVLTLPERIKKLRLPKPKKEAVPEKVRKELRIANDEELQRIMDDLEEELSDRKFESAR